MRRLIIGLALMVMGAAASYGDVTISNVNAHPVLPWGKVVIDYIVSGELPECADAAEIHVKAYDVQYGSTCSLTSIVGDTNLFVGKHRIVCDLEGVGMNVSSDEVRFEVYYDHHKTYCVIDVSQGPEAECFPVVEMDAAPAGGWSEDYKTNKIVLKRLDGGKFQMRGRMSGYGTYESVDVTLSRPFYIGLFEITQRQWELVMGTRPSYFSNENYYMCRPVEQVSYAMVRGSSSGAKWPEIRYVDSSSFLGRLRSKTGLDFDLPTEAQWEYACRAGTKTDYYNGTSTYDSSRIDGRYIKTDGSISMSWYEKDDDTVGTAKVGSYSPNPWGLYDMYGNVWEMCCDWFGDLGYGGDPKNDPAGSTSGSSRVMRGGGFFSGRIECSSYSRVGNVSYGETRGFRIVWVLEK